MNKPQTIEKVVKDWKAKKKTEKALRSALGAALSAYAPEGDGQAGPNDPLLANLLQTLDRAFGKHGDGHDVNHNTGCWGCKARFDIREAL